MASQNFMKPSKIVPPADKARKFLVDSRVKPLDAHISWSILSCRKGRQIRCSTHTDTFHALWKFVSDEIQVQKDKGDGYAIALGAHPDAQKSVGNSTCSTIEMVHLDCDGKVNVLTMGEFVDYLTLLDIQAIVFPSPSEKAENWRDAKRYRALIRTTRFTRIEDEPNINKMWQERFHSVRLCMVGSSKDKDTGKYPQFDETVQNLSALAYIHPRYFPRTKDNVIFVEGNFIIDIEHLCESMKANEFITKKNFQDIALDPEKVSEEASALFEALKRNDFITGQRNDRGFYPTRCPRENEHASSSYGSDSCAYNPNSYHWYCMHEHSGGQRKGQAGTHLLTTWFLENYPDEVSLISKKGSKAAYLVGQIANLNAMQNSSPIIPTIVSNEILSSISSVLREHTLSEHGSLLVQNISVGAGKSHEIPKIVKLHREIVSSLNTGYFESQEDGDNRNISAIVLVRDRAGIYAAMNLAEEDGIKCAYQQSIDSVKKEDGTHVCHWATKAKMLSERGIDARQILCRGGGSGKPCPKSLLGCGKMCPAEKGFAGSQNPELVFATHAGAPGMDRFRRQNVLVISDEAEVKQVEQVTLDKPTIIAISNRMRVYSRVTLYAWVMLLRAIKNDFCYLDTEPCKREGKVKNTLRDAINKECEETLNMLRYVCFGDSIYYSTWNNEVTRMKNEWIEACKKAEEDGIEPPKEPVYPTAPTHNMITNDELVNYLLYQITAATRILTLKANLSLPIELFQEELEKEVGPRNIAKCTEAVSRWIDGANVFPVTDNEGRINPGARNVSWFGPMTRFVRDHVLHESGLGILLDATADQHFWRGVVTEDRLEYKRAVVEEQANVRRVCIASKTALSKYLLNQKLGVNWAWFHKLLANVIVQLKKEYPGGEKKIAFCSRMAISLPVNYILSGLNETDIVDVMKDTSHPLSAQTSANNNKSTVYSSLLSCPEKTKKLLLKLKESFPRMIWTHYGSPLSIGSNALKEYDGFISIGDPIPHQSNVQAVTAITKRGMMEQSEFDAQCTLEQWFGRARAIRRKDENIFFLHVGYCIPISWSSVEIVNADHLIEDEEVDLITFTSTNSVDLDDKSKTKSVLPLNEISFVETNKERHRDHLESNINSEIESAENPACVLSGLSNSVSFRINYPGAVLLNASDNLCAVEGTSVKFIDPISVYHEIQNQKIPDPVMNTKVITTAKTERQYYARFLITLAHSYFNGEEFIQRMIDFCGKDYTHYREVLLFRKEASPSMIANILAFLYVHMTSTDHKHNLYLAKYRGITASRRIDLISNQMRELANATELNPIYFTDQCLKDFICGRATKASYDSIYKGIDYVIKKRGYANIPKMFNPMTEEEFCEILTKDIHSLPFDEVKQAAYMAHGQSRLDFYNTFEECNKTYFESKFPSVWIIEGSPNNMKHGKNAFYAKSSSKKDILFSMAYYGYVMSNEKEPKDGDEAWEGVKKKLSLK